MKKVLMIALTVLISAAFVTTVFAQAPAGTTEKKTTTTTVPEKKETTTTTTTVPDKKETTKTKTTKTKTTLPESSRAFAGTRGNFPRLKPFAKTVGVASSLSIISPL